VGHEKQVVQVMLYGMDTECTVSNSARSFWHATAATRPRDMTQGERPFADTLILPPRDELREDSRYDHWLKLADIALATAREEQARIKEQIRPHVERYRQLRGQRPWQSPSKK